MQSFAKRASLAALLLGGTCAVVAWTRHMPIPAPPEKPAVALVVDIAAMQYRDHLQDSACTARCAELRASVADSLRVILRQAYPFLRLVPRGTPAPDTLLVLWVDRPPRDIPGSRLVYAIVGPAKRLPQGHHVDFEDYPEFARRLNGYGWDLDSLRRDWARQLRRDIIRPDLLTVVFSKIPFSVKPTRAAGSARTYIVPLRGVDIGIARDARPTFVFQASINDRVKQSLGDADLLLGPCELHQSRQAYSCDVTRVTYLGSKQIISAPDSIVALIGRSNIESRGVQVIEMDRETASDNGAVYVPSGGGRGGQIQ